MIRRPPRSTLFPYTTALPIYRLCVHERHEPVAVLVGMEEPEAQKRLKLRRVRQDVLLVGRDKGATARLVRRSEEHTSELQSQSNIVCRLLLEKKKRASISYIP